MRAYEAEIKVTKARFAKLEALAVAKTARATKKRTALAGGGGGGGAAADAGSSSSSSSAAAAAHARPKKKKKAAPLTEWQKLLLEYGKGDRSGEGESDTDAEQ